MSLPEPLSRQFERAARQRLSEADVQRVIIEPLLSWLGYDIYDLDQVQEQVPVEGAGRGAFTGAIDYALMVEKRTHALVEAKLPGATPKALLEDRQAIQQINAYCYSHADRPRWGVLTNGLFWVVYDAQAAGDVFSRVILQVDIGAEPDLLRALSPAWAGHLTRFADLLSEARTVSSGGIRERAMREIQREYREIFSGPTPTATAAAPEARPEPRRRGPPSESPRQAQARRGSSERTDDGPVLAATRHEPPAPGSKPRSVLLPSGQLPVRSWADIVPAAAEFVLARGGSLRKFRDRWGGRKAIVADRGSRVLTKPRALSDGSVVETNWSSTDAMMVACAILEAAGENPESLVVNYVMRGGGD